MTINDSSKSPLDILIKRELSSIEFVRDYYQFRFDGPVLTVITEPMLIIGKDVYTRGTAEFYSRLIDCIGCTVSKADVIENDAIIIAFSNENILRVSLKSEDYLSTEAVIFSADQSEGSWIW